MPIWLLWIGKRFGHWLIYIIFTAIIGWVFYAGLIRPITKPNPSTQMKAETIINNSYNCKALIGWGCGRCSK